jgi:hypothetical protein
MHALLLLPLPLLLLLLLLTACSVGLPPSCASPSPQQAAEGCHCMFSTVLESNEITYVRIK